MWKGYENYNHFFYFDQKVDWFNEIALGQPKVVSTGKQSYWNVPCCFDIETSSYKEYGQKFATMYVWSLCVNGSTIVGRTWDEFQDIIEFLAKNLNTKKNKLIIYVHNLGFEFQFMRKWFEWKDVFAVKERRPVHASLENGIEFKCSYILSNYALAYIGENLIRRYSVAKDVGAVDYSLVRTWRTPLSDEEIWYNVHDVQVVTSFIQEKIENEGGIDKIPLTNTGYVRNYCRNFCFTQQVSEPKLMKKLKARYHERMKSLKIVSECEYDQLHQAFAGGFTHAAPLHSGKTLFNVGSADLASSYPSVMVRKKFPMARGTFIGKSDIETITGLTQTGDYCLLFTINMKNLTPKFIYENYISVSRCQILSDDYVSNNGRVASASEIQLTITEQDWDIIDKCYDWDREATEIHNLRIYPADYLPRPFILSILKLYGDKTSLKGIPEKEIEYMVSKNMINSAYGMSVTAIIRDLYEYSNTKDWVTESANVSKQLTDYNNSYQRFLFYGWGVWVTAHARHCLWEAIFEFEKDYVYADTDSIKGLNFEKHQDFFDLYNLSVKCELRKMCNYWQIDFNSCQPETKSGIKKLIGVWEREEDYLRFKTIGAKRYLYEHTDHSLNFTISGVNKKYGVPYLLEEYGLPGNSELYRLVYRPNYNEKEESKKAKAELSVMIETGELKYDRIFDAFTEGLYFPASATGKQTLTYSDEEYSGDCVDYLGIKAPVMEMSYIHMEPQSYYMSQTAEYMQYLMGFKDASL